jgi:uncharacterized protein YgiM (DUF1202 family)
VTTYVNTADKGKLNLRAEPSKIAKVLTQIPYKTQLEVEQIDNVWSKTTYNGYTGYVMTEFLSGAKTITKKDLQQIYDSLKSTLSTIEKILK